MATKSYTDLQQSKKLTDILPLESADMCYLPTHIDDEHHFIASLSPYSMCSKMTDISIKYCTPCWSLAVLLDVLPVGTESHKQSDGSISYYHVEVYNNKKYFSTKRYSNLIDACYEMILKLHELKML